MCSDYVLKYISCTPRRYILSVSTVMHCQAGQLAMDSGEVNHVCACTCKHMVQAYKLSFFCVTKLRCKYCCVLLLVSYIKRSHQNRVSFQGIAAKGEPEKEAGWERQSPRHPPPQSPPGPSDLPYKMHGVAETPPSSTENSLKGFRL